MNDGDGCYVRDALIRVLLVEDHSAFRQALALTFGLEPDLEIVGQARGLADVRATISTVSALDVVVLDLDLQDGHGFDLIPDIHAAYPSAHVLVLTASKSHKLRARAIEAGAAGLLHKSADIHEIMFSVRKLASGGWLFSPTEVSRLLREVRIEHTSAAGHGGRVHQLTRREQDVLHLLAEGLSDKEISARLRIGKDTVHTHMVNLMNKLGVESRLQALIVAIRLGLVTIERDT